MVFMCSKNRIVTICKYHIYPTINIFFRCPDWTIATSYVDAIFMNGSLLSAANWKSIPYQLFDAFGWVFFVFCVHEGERYLSIKDHCTQKMHWWVLSCLIMFVSILALGISGPQFIYYQF